jgi:hypothetical protein
MHVYIEGIRIELEIEEVEITKSVENVLQYLQIGDDVEVGSIEIENKEIAEVEDEVENETKEVENEVEREIKEIVDIVELYEVFEGNHSLLLLSLYLRCLVYIEDSL